MNTIMTASLKGFPITWAMNGHVYFGRGLFDLLREDLQGKHFICKTPGEFENVCNLLSAN